MGQYELNLDPERMAAREHMQTAAEYLQGALEITTRARSEEEAYGNIIGGLACIQSLEKEARKTLSSMPALFIDSKATIESVNKIKHIAEAIGMIAVEWAAKANICLKELAFQKKAEGVDENG